MKILVVLPRFPYPLEKGDKLRAYHQIVELSKRHSIYLFCVSHTRVVEAQIEALRPYCAGIRVVHLFRPACWWGVVRNWLLAKSLQMGYWGTAKAKRACKAFCKAVEPDVVYGQMLRTMPLTARLPYPKVMDFQDALSMNAERRMDKARGFWHYVLHFEFKMLRSSEYNAFSIYDALTIISEVDADAIPHKRSGEIRIVPNGVDFDYFSRADEGAGCGEKRYDIVFCGNMSYAPNIDAVRYLTEEVMPKVWAKRPETTVLIAGTSPKRRVSKLGADSRVAVSGWMEDIREAYRTARVFAAPMQIGSGLQNKLLEAMAMGLPCATTTIAAAAIGIEDGRHALVADGAEAFAESLLTLLCDEARAEALAEEGYRYVRERFGWEPAVEKLEAVLNEVAK